MEYHCPFTHEKRKIFDYEGVKYCGVCWMQNGVLVRCVVVKTNDKEKK